MIPSAGRPPEGRQVVAVNLPITLGQFVKLAGLASTGGDAKRLVTTGAVRVNGEVESRRGRKLALGDVVEMAGAVIQVADRQAPGATTARD